MNNIRGTDYRFTYVVEWQGLMQITYHNNNGKQ
jgi:hypothetical protein